MRLLHGQYTVAAVGEPTVSAVEHCIKSRAVTTISQSNLAKPLTSPYSSMATLKSENGWPESKLDVRQVVDVTEGDTDEKLGTEHDQRGMIRMGKKQELRREFRFFSIWGFAVMLGCS